MLTITIERTYCRKPDDFLRKDSRASPGLGVLGERGEAAGVHVAAYVDVHRRVGLGELRWRRDALITERRRWRSGDHRPGHVGAIILLKDKMTTGK